MNDRIDMAGRSRQLKLAVIGVFLMLVAAFTLTYRHPVARASASGPSPSFTDAPAEGNCTACHIGSPINSGEGDLQISGLPAAYVPGQEIAITVSLSQANAVVYGFQLTAIDSAGKTVGVFTLPASSPSRMQTVSNIVQGDQRDYVEHTVDGLIGTEFGSNSWTFKWTAPPDPSGTITFYAAGNAANGDGSPAGDLIYSTSKVLQQASPTISISGRVLTANGTGLRNAVVRIASSDISVTAPTSSLGYYSFSDIPNGKTYTITVASKRYRFEPRILTVSADLTDLDFNGLE